MSLLLTYLEAMRARRGLGATKGEESYYGYIEAFLTEVGKRVQPRVRCAIQLGNEGHGFPDGGLFTADQHRVANLAKPLGGQKPARGAVEIKDTSVDIVPLVNSAQIRKYLNAYDQVLLTNYRDFLLLTVDGAGNPLIQERMTIAPTEADFWTLPILSFEARASRIEGYLERVILRRARISAPEDLAKQLASFAREARLRIDGKPAGHLEPLKVALEQALGLTFKGPEGDDFFRATLIQTLFYGMFSAWVLWHRALPTRGDSFDWRSAMHFLHVPAIQALFGEITVPTRLRPLDVEDILNWATEVLNRVDRPAFFRNFDAGRAVPYFYEPFLEAYDPELRKRLGVWYTPDEVVDYMVARSHDALVNELGIPDGFASPDVVVLDPCCGTGAFLSKVLQRINDELTSRLGPALAAERTKEAALTRVLGFELLPAPFVIAHLQVGLLLGGLGAPLTNPTERPAVFLSNALTGWRPAPPAPPLPFPELGEERDHASKVKQARKVIVVIGNPPYSGFAGVSPQEEEGLVEPYKTGLRSQWGIKRSNLNDLYVRFFRIAERRIVDMTGHGVICYISNFAYLDDPSAVVMRQRLVSEFDSIWIDNLNGDSRETGKKTPAGASDPSVFSTPANPAGIRMGTCVSLLVRGASPTGATEVRYRDFWGRTKRTDLAASLPVVASNYRAVSPTPVNRYNLRPSAASPAYANWPDVCDLAELQPSLGLLENRRGALVDGDRISLERRMKTYLDPASSFTDAENLGTGLTDSSLARFDPRRAWSSARASGGFDPSAVRRLALRPFDIVWAYQTTATSVWNEPRAALVASWPPGVAAIVTRRQRETRDEGVPFYVTSVLGSQHALHKDGYYIPMRIRLGSGSITANLSVSARKYLQSIGVANPDTDEPELIWQHVVAVGFAPRYVAENRDGLGQGFPHVPMPASLEQLRHSAQLGARLGLLLDPEITIPGVTTGTIRPELGVIARLQGARPLDLKVTGGWGRGGGSTPVMPGPGRTVERPFEPEELRTIQDWRATAGSSLAESERVFGRDTLDIYLSDDTVLRNVPKSAWDFRIGGFQVIKKWLSYRDASVLGRAISLGEAEQLIGMIRRLTSLVMIGPELDSNFSSIVAASAWPP